VLLLHLTLYKLQLDRPFSRRKTVVCALTCARVHDQAADQLGGALSELSSLADHSDGGL